MLANQDDLARLMTISRASPRRVKGEVCMRPRAEWFGESQASRRHDGHQPDGACVIKQPIGVVACITPWNFPLR
jgi:acyl-CoA reductase-like NAD-dependent aldehyde dehydrogenase